MAGEVKCRAFAARGLHQFGEHARRHGTVAERLPVGVPRRDGGVEFGVGLAWTVWPGQPEFREQLWLPGVRKQPDHGLAATYRDRQPQVEQRGAACDVDGAALRI